jgi:hypothetical protein
MQTFFHSFEISSEFDLHALTQTKRILPEKFGIGFAGNFNQ